MTEQSRANLFEKYNSLLAENKQLKKQSNLQKEKKSSLPSHANKVAGPKPNTAQAVINLARDNEF